MADGPEIGSKLEQLFGKQADGQRRSWTFPASSDLIAIFISPQCQTCNALLPHVKDFARENERLEVVLVSTLDNPEMNRAYVGYQRLEKLSYIVNQELADELAIEGTPYAVYLNEQGIVSAKGLVNNYENLVGLAHSASNFDRRLAQTQSHVVFEKEQAS